MAGGGRVLEQGSHDVLIGASSEDIRLRTTVLLDGEPVRPASGGPAGLAEAGGGWRAPTSTSSQPGTAIVGRTRSAGDTVTPVGSGSGELAYRSCDFGTGVTGRGPAPEGSGAGPLPHGGDAPILNLPENGSH